MGSKKYKLNGKDGKVTGIVFLCGAAVALLEYTGVFAGMVDWEGQHDLMMAVIPALITAGIRWVRDNSPK